MNEVLLSDKNSLVWSHKYNITKRETENNGVQKKNFLYELFFVIILSKHLFSQLSNIEFLIIKTRRNSLFVTPFSTSFVLIIKPYNKGEKLFDILPMQNFVLTYLKMTLA